MSNRLHIDGTQNFGYNPIKRFLYSFYIFHNTVKRVCDLYHYASVQDLKGYVAHFLYIRYKSFETLLKVTVELKDYVTACCILRMLGDCVSIFHLIYCEPDKDLLLLRHALYVIDGCERNLEVLTEEGVNKGCLPDDEYEEERKGVLFNREHRQRLMREAQEILDNSSLKERDRKAFERIVEDRNWKFKEFKVYNKNSIKSNQYQWKEMYERIDRCQYFDILSYISQYAHGLSMSNLVTQMNERNLNSILCEALVLLERLNSYTLGFFVEEKQYILEGLLEPEMRDKILNCFDYQHRPSNYKWYLDITRQIRESFIKVWLNEGRVERI